LNLSLGQLCSAVQLLCYFYMGWKQITVALLTVTAAGAALTFAIDLRQIPTAAAGASSGDSVASAEGLPAMPEDAPDKAALPPI
jgi:hypothetical protein